MEPAAWDGDAAVDLLLDHLEIRDLHQTDRDAEMGQGAELVAGIAGVAKALHRCQVLVVAIVAHSGHGFQNAQRQETQGICQKKPRHALSSLDTDLHSCNNEETAGNGPFMAACVSLKFAILVLAILVSAVTRSANAKAGEAVIVPMVGCGTACMVYQKQAGQPYEDSKGLRKVRVKQTFEISTAGLGGTNSRKTYLKYFIAECTKRKANFTSFASNGTGEDDILRWIDVPYDPELRKYGPNWATYLQFDRICALKL